MKNPKQKWMFRIEDCPPLPVIEGVEIRHLDGHIGIAAANDGNLWSCRNQGWGGKWRLLSRRSTNSDGYVNTQVAGKRGIVGLKFASAICAAFHGPRPSPEMQACHKDGSRTNDRADNLYWGTPRDNTDDRLRHGRKSGPPPEKTNTAKLTWAKALWIRSQHGLRSPRDLAQQFGVTVSSICAVWKNRTWKQAA